MPLHYRAIWPVLDESLPLTDLIDEANRDLPQLLRRSRLRAAARPRWCLRPGRDVPGSGGARTVLVCDVAVAQIPRDVDALTGEPDEPDCARWRRRPRRTRISSSTTPTTTRRTA